MSHLLHDEERRMLLGVARRSIAHGLAHGAPLPVDAHAYPPPLRTPRATFVTLEIGGALRGCIGSLTATRPLVEDVAHNAFMAAFRDPRFEPVSGDEERTLEVHVAVLQPPEELAVDSEEALAAALRPGVDGLILEAGRRRATFLPSVWASLPDPAAFIRQLKRKAGLDEATWPDGVRVQRYTTESFGDGDVAVA